MIATTHRITLGLQLLLHSIPTLELLVLLLFPHGIMWYCSTAAQLYYCCHCHGAIATATTLSVTSHRWSCYNRSTAMVAYLTHKTTTSLQQLQQLLLLRSSLTANDLQLHPVLLPQLLLWVANAAMLVAATATADCYNYNSSYHIDIANTASLCYHSSLILLSQLFLLPHQLSLMQKKNGNCNCCHS
jgi:hypothetical protein